MVCENSSEQIIKRLTGSVFYKLWRSKSFFKKSFSFETSLMASLSSKDSSLDAVGRVLRIGTRGSALSVLQGEMVARALREHGGVETALVKIKTKGDRFLDKPLSALGGKELFVREIEEALLGGAVDLAVHSLKDMPFERPSGLRMEPIFARADPRDALVVSLKGGIAGLGGIRDLPHGARVGVAGPRRAAQLLHLRSDLRLALLRGNVDTRLRKLSQRGVDAACLALAGLKRLDLAQDALALSPSEILPAAGQGALAVEWREEDQTIGQLLEPLHAPEREMLLAERAFSSAFGGSCHVPVAALALREGEKVVLRGQILSRDGVRAHEIERACALGKGEAMGYEAGVSLKESLEEAFLKDLFAGDEGEFPPRRAERAR